MKQTKLTEGPIVQTLLKLAVPIMASSFLSTAYNIMDMAWVGLLGSRVVAGIGVGGMYTWFAGGISNLSRMGGQVHAAQSIGKDRKDEAREYARAALQLTIIFGVLYAVLSLLFTHQMVGFFRLHDELAETTAVGYIRITCGLILFSFLNNTLTGLYTAQGDSRTPLRANFFGLALNMFLDPMLILGVGIFPKLGAAGAAVATVASQAVVTIFLLAGMRKKENILFHEQPVIWKLSGKPIYKNIVKTGFPTAVQNCVYCFISMVLSRIVARFGPEGVAVSRVGGQIEAITWNMADGFASAMNAFCGQNYGAKKYDRIREGYHFSLVATFAWGTMVFLAFLFAPKAIAGVFFHEPVAFDIFVKYLMILSICEPFMAVELVTIGSLAGLGKTKLCSIVSVLVTSMRIPIAYFLQAQIGVNGVWWALTVTSVMKGIIFTIVFEMWIRKHRK